MQKIFNLFGILVVVLILFCCPLWFVMPEQLDLSNSFLNEYFSFANFFNLEFSSVTKAIASVYLLLIGKTAPNTWLHVAIIFSGILLFFAMFFSTEKFNSARGVAYSCIGWLMIICSVLALNKFKNSGEVSLISTQIVCYAIWFLACCYFLNKKNMQAIVTVVLMLSAIVVSYSAITQVIPKERISLQNYAAKERGFNSFAEWTNHIEKLKLTTNEVVKTQTDLLQENNLKNLEELNRYIGKLSNAFDSIDIALNLIAKSNDYQNFEEMTNQMTMLWKVDREIEYNMEFYSAKVGLRYKQLQEAYPKAINLYSELETGKNEQSKKIGYADYQELTQKIAALTMPIEQQLLDRLISNRSFGTFINPNSLGGFLIICIPVFLGLLVCQRSFVVKLAAVLSLGICWVALAASKSKSSLLILCVTLVLLFLLTAFSKKLKGWIAFSLSGLVIVVTLVALNWGYKDNFSEKIQRNSQARLEYYQAAFNMIKANPIIGYGSDGFSKNYLKYAAENAEFTRLTHNAFLNIWVDFGLIAALGLLIIFILPLLRIFIIIEKYNFDFFGLTCLIAWLNFVLHSMVDFDFHILGIVLPALLVAAFTCIPRKNTNF